MFKKGVYAGTFGPLHVGHKKIIKTAMGICEHLVIGIMDNSSAQDKVGGTDQHIPSWEERKEKIKCFMDENFYYNYSIEKLEDGIVEGKNFDGDVIIISDESDVINRTLTINRLRREEDIEELNIVIIPRVRDKDGKIISSTRIRKGEFDGRR